MPLSMLAVSDHSCLWMEQLRRRWMELVPHANANRDMKYLLKVVSAVEMSPD